MRESERAQAALAVFDLLGNPQRNRALYAIQQQDLPLSLDRLAALVTEARPDRPSADQETAEKRCAMSLHHTHLPKLDEAGVIRYDSEKRVVVSLDEDSLDSLLTTGREILDSLKE